MTLAVECSILLTGSPFSLMGDERKSHQEIKLICAPENVVTLLFIIPAEKNLEREMTTEDNEREQRWQYEMTDKTN